MAHIPRQHFSKIFQQTSAADLANNRLIFARFPRQGGRTARPYSSRTAVFGTEIEAASGCFVQLSFVAFWHIFRGPYTSIYCCFGTDFKVAVQLHLLQISGHANREIRTTFIAIPVLLFVRFPRRWLSTEKEISCKSLFADYLFC